VTLVIDAAPLVALGDEDDPVRPLVRQVLQQESGDLVIPAPVTAEVDYLLGRRVGHRARKAFLADLAALRFRVVCLEHAEYETVRRLDEKYDDLNFGLSDLSVVVIAHRFHTNRVLTFDERGFRVMTPLDGDHFVVLPRDEYDDRPR